MEHIAQYWTGTFVSGCGANEVEIMTYLIKLLPTLLLIFHNVIDSNRYESNRYEWKHIYLQLFIISIEVGVGVGVVAVGVVGEN